jgi:transcriptional regulator with XRE-family HTH domain
MARPPTRLVGRELTPFGRVFRHLRTQQGLSQVAIATRAGVSTGYVGLIETGGRGGKPSLDVVKRFAQALNANLDETEDLLKAAGWLRPGESLLQVDRPTTPHIIESDPFLDDTQKSLLIGIYQQMVRHQAG